MAGSIRHAIYQLFYMLSVLWFGTTGLLLHWAPFSWRSRYITQWNRSIVWAARVILNVRVEIEGLQHLPASACVVMSKHQSEWETFYLPTQIQPLCTIMKRELLGIPLFGWALAQLDPIAIDRSSPKEALKKVQSEGLQRLADGRHVLVFPEGTRVAPGEKGRYARSGANLAISARVPIVPIAHNAGCYWPSGGARKKPGTMRFRIGEPIHAGDMNAAQLTASVEEWIETHSRTLYELAAPAMAADAAGREARADVS